MIKQVAHLLGPSLMKAGKFPTFLARGDDMQSKTDQLPHEDDHVLERGSWRPISSELERVTKFTA